MKSKEYMLPTEASYIYVDVASIATEPQLQPYAMDPALVSSPHGPQIES